MLLLLLLLLLRSTYLCLYGDIQRYIWHHTLAYVSVYVFSVCVCVCFYLYMTLLESNPLIVFLILFFYSVICVNIVTTLRERAGKTFFFLSASNIILLGIVYRYQDVYSNKVRLFAYKICGFSLFSLELHLCLYSIRSIFFDGGGKVCCNSM